MAKELKPGDEVTWNTSQGETEGKVERKITSDERIKGHVANATPENPQYVVKTSKSHKEAIHKPGALHKKKS